MCTVWLGDDLRKGRRKRKRRKRGSRAPQRESSVSVHTFGRIVHEQPLRLRLQASRADVSAWTSGKEQTGVTQNKGDRTSWRPLHIRMKSHRASSGGALTVLATASFSQEARSHIPYRRSGPAVFAGTMDAFPRLIATATESSQVWLVPLGSTFTALWSQFRVKTQLWKEFQTKKKRHGSKVYRNGTLELMCEFSSSGDDRNMEEHGTKRLKIKGIHGFGCDQ